MCLGRQRLRAIGDLLSRALLGLLVMPFLRPVRIVTWTSLWQAGGLVNKTSSRHILYDIAHCRHSLHASNYQMNGSIHTAVLL